jgi:quercetin dioxygenase-like cupin family protein
MTFNLSELDPNDPRWKKQGAVYVRAGEGPTIWGPGDVYTIKAAAADTNGGFGLIEATVPPGGGSGAHAHGDEEESFYIIDGKVEFLDGDRTFTASSGDYVHIPRGIRHRFANKSYHTAKMLFWFTPGGVETFMRDTGKPARPGEPAPPLNETDMEVAREAMRQLNLITLFEPGWAPATDSDES